MNQLKEFLSLSKVSNAENASSYKLQIEMQQIPFVMPRTTAITAAQAASVQDAETSLLGQAQSKEVKNNKTLLLNLGGMLRG